jgi:hypothetical protein
MRVTSHGGIILTGKTEELGEKPVPQPLRSPHMPHGMTRGRTRAPAVRGLPLTAVVNDTASPSSVRVTR